MGDFKTNILYLGFYLERNQKIDRSVKIFLAIASNSSIALWAVWQKYPMFWAGIIACSQLISAVKEFLPYQKRTKMIAGLYADLQDAFLHAEKNWFSIAEGDYSEQQIHEAWIDLKKRKNSFLKKHFGTEVLPQNNKFLKKAEEEQVQYFNTFYFDGEEYE